MPMPRQALKKMSRGMRGSEVSNREASNRVDRSHSEYPDDWIRLLNYNRTCYQRVNVTVA
jgi:hypothetical protein